MARIRKYGVFLLVIRFLSSNVDDDFQKEEDEVVVVAKGVLLDLHEADLLGL